MWFILPLKKNAETLGFIVSDYNISQNVCLTANCYDLNLITRNLEKEAGESTSFSLKNHLLLLLFFPFFLPLRSMQLKSNELLPAFYPSLMEQTAFKKTLQMAAKGSHSLSESSLRLTVKISYFQMKIVPRGQSSVLGPRLGKHCLLFLYLPKVI